MSLTKPVCFLIPIILIFHSAACGGNEVEGGYFLDMVSQKEVNSFCQRNDHRVVKHLGVEWVLSDRYEEPQSDEFSTHYISKAELKSDGYISVLNFEKRIHDYEMYVVPKRSALKQMVLSPNDSRKVYMLPSQAPQSRNHHTTYSWLIEIESGLLNINSTDALDVFYGLGLKEFERFCGTYEQKE